MEAVVVTELVELVMDVAAKKAPISTCIFSSTVSIHVL